MQASAPHQWTKETLPKATSDLFVDKSNDGLSVWGSLDLKGIILCCWKCVLSSIFYLWSLTLSHPCNSILFSQNSKVKVPKTKPFVLFSISTCSPWRPCLVSGLRSHLNADNFQSHFLSLEPPSPELRSYLRNCLAAQWLVCLKGSQLVMSVTKFLIKPTYSLSQLG